MKNNLKHWKSTLIGFLMIVAGFYYQFQIIEPNIVFSAGAVLIGTALLFAKDKFIDILLTFLKEK